MSDLIGRWREMDKSQRKTFQHDLVGRFEKAVVQYSPVGEGWNDLLKRLPGKEY